MQNIPLVSIIINNFNYAQFLAEAIDSALNQTYPNIESIIVDDGSTDHSREIIASYGEQVIPIFQENGKQGKAFNSGFIKSTGDIVIFLDSDDFLFPQAVEQIVQVWSPQLAKVHYRLKVVNSSGEDAGYTLPQGGGLTIGKIGQRLLNGDGYSSTPTSGNALNRKALEKLFPISDEYRTTADDYLSTLIPFFGEVAAIEEPLGAYRIHSSNQWALSTVTGAHFRRFLQHDDLVRSLIIRKSKELGVSLPNNFDLKSVGRFRVRLISLRLDPDQHEYPSDSRLQLIRLGILSLWKYSDYNKAKCLVFSLWFLWVGFMPLLLVKPAITWSYAPHYRPKAIDWFLKSARTLMS